jgi:predicted phage baseplate assembly protein
MVFDFLPKLPKSDLDDRDYEDLVKECILRIPRYCPEWTNYNPSDPGITLIELFAWLTDQMLSRFNQVPRRNYITFLELLGVRLQPPNPAKTELTFYLVGNLSANYRIAAGTPVATERTASSEAIVFTTDQPLIVGNPTIEHFLTAEEVQQVPQVLRDRFTNFWSVNAEGQWSGPELSLFNDYSQPGNCFYLVFDANEPLEGNVVAITVKGQEATPTGINPNHPPRRWEAWNGNEWQPVLLEESDDETQGFSFSNLAYRGGNLSQGSDVILHLPVNFPPAHFTAYRGRWLRCVFTEPEARQSGYSRSPRIIGISAQAIGGTVPATQCEIVEDEVMGESTGEPGQTFQLMRIPVLDRREDEYLIVTPPGGLPEQWQEVKDFADSGPTDRHYTLDSVTGVVQFGPVVRESTQLKQATELRVQLQTSISRQVLLSPPNSEQQYGAIPPSGASVRMSRYRTGGGSRGNVRANTLEILKTAVPYVASVTNHGAARYGADAETLEQAAIRVPQVLRTRDRAVTAEDFEQLAIRGGQGAVAHAHCLPATAGGGGTVNLLIVPQVSTQGIERGEGIHPDRFALTPPLEQQILAYLDQRRLLGVHIQCDRPAYTGVAVQTEVALKPEYNNPTARAEIQRQMLIALYRFFNPITGGTDGKGWQLGQPVYPSDAIAVLQQFDVIRYIGTLQLFELRFSNQSWRRLPPAPIIDPGPLGLICSWADLRVGSEHLINFIQ